MGRRRALGYQTLYREWRPATLAHVSGQEHVKRTLTNMLKTGRVPHALLLAGPRGTGKTSVAKIVARAVNCEQGVTSDPCLVCASCVGIGQNTSLDVLEIDAASNRGIDEIRELRENVKYAPSRSRYKVYIIDEVHMLTNEAFNALLKTLEEPPGHVLFVLATTEPHKLPATIISRCQRFDFRRLRADTIAERLEQIATAIDVKISQAALRMIALQAGGAMRDALGLFEQCVAHAGADGLIEVQHVEAVSGSVPTEVYLRLLRALTQGDMALVLAELNDEVIKGREAGQLLSSYIATLRMLLLAAHSPAMLVDFGYEPAQVEALKEIATGMAKVIAPVIEVALQAEGELRYGGHQQLALEVMLLKQYAIIVGPGAAARPAVQDKMREKTTQDYTGQERNDKMAAATSALPKPEPSQPEPPPPSSPALGSVAMLLKVWPEVLKSIKQKAPLTGATLGAVVPIRMEGNLVILQMRDNNVHTFKRLSSSVELGQIREAFAKVMGMAVEVQIKLPSSEAVAPTMSHEEQVKQVLEIFQGTLVDENH